MIPLPCILYSKDEGLSVFMSSKFGFDLIGHGEGHKAYDRYVLDGGVVKRVLDNQFPMGSVETNGFVHQKENRGGKDVEVAYVCMGDRKYELESKSIADGGLFGGGLTSFYDFSITKNVTSMILVFLLMLWMFVKVAKAYKQREGQAPKGLQGFIETIFIFIQDEVAKPFLGPYWEKYLPFLMSLFFFILGLNLWGQIPFFGGANVTGNLGVTAILAIMTFFVVNLNGNKDYWEHIVWMPGVPAWVKTVVTPVEILGIFIKPLTLMLRLFANITAGHMVMVIFVGLIFVFGKSGESVGGSYGTAVGSTLLTMFMMAIELLVAFIQAFVFTILTASYIGAAVEEHHH
jgi:F-type H+-transporting ATPase subunit a